MKFKLIIITVLLISLTLIGFEQAKNQDTGDKPDNQIVTA